MSVTDLNKHLRDAHGITGFQSNVRQIVYGGNDGIVTTFAIVAGFAGAGAEGAAQIGTLAVILFGLANLFADATAMGLGEFLSSRSERDMYRATRRKEENLLKESPEAEYAEVIDLLRQQGLSAADAASFASELKKHPKLMLDFMMRYEFSMGDADDSDGIKEGFYTFISFLVFGVVPLIPYFLLDAVQSTFYLSISATFAALIALGVLRWWATRENLLRSIGETVLVGGTCAIVAFIIGMIVGG